MHNFKASNNLLGYNPSQVSNMETTLQKAGINYRKEVHQTNLISGFGGVCDLTQFFYNAGGVEKTAWELGSASHEISLVYELENDPGYYAALELLSYLDGRGKYENRSLPNYPKLCFQLGVSPNPSVMKFHGYE